MPSHVHWNNPIKQSRFVVLSALAVSFLSFIGHSYVYIQEYEAKNNIEFKLLLSGKPFPHIKVKG